MPGKNASKLFYGFKLPFSWFRRYSVALHLWLFLQSSDKVNSEGFCLIFPHFSEGKGPYSYLLNHFDDIFTFLFSYYLIGLSSHCWILRGFVCICFGYKFFFLSDICFGYKFFFFIRYMFCKFFFWFVACIFILVLVSFAEHTFFYFN